ncbi:hypothetical protein [Modestobacter roseus]|uniref:Uncharacterized protein n=1 Tax=Modestobacter roseus TaxID=1181884 RepID=A0A562IRI7_9ACTN|nr:hypothetical protein [Modestobacter roseus]TWH73548.1 hypothetical protein JD78_02071 [Modestobacter roseus]
MLRTLLLLLALVVLVWVALSIVGWVLKGLFWLAVVALAVVAGTAMLNSSRRR